VLVLTFTRFWSNVCTVLSSSYAHDQHLHHVHKHPPFTDGLLRPCLQVEPGPQVPQEQQVGACAHLHQVLVKQTYGSDLELCTREQHL